VTFALQGDLGILRFRGLNEAKAKKEKKFYPTSGVWKNIVI